MSTQSSRLGFNYYSDNNGRVRRQKENKVIQIFKDLGGSGTINRVSTAYRMKYPEKVRDVCGVIVGLYMSGRLNIDEANPIKGETKFLQSVYYIPTESLTKEEVLRRQLEQAEIRLAEAQKKVVIIQEELELHNLEFTDFKAEYHELSVKLCSGFILNRGELRRYEKLKKVIETGWKPGRLKTRNQLKKSSS